jgi:chemosensory pili system protein ChpE
METLFISAFGLSIAFAAQPGVITFESIRRGLSGGARAALLLECGSLVGDATWALIALSSAAFLFQNRIIAFILSFFGCYLLLRFAWDAWQSAYKAVKTSPAAHGQRGDFATGVVLSLSNPHNITFWLGMSGTIISLGFLNPQPEHLVTFFAGFMIAQVVWAFLIAWVIGWGNRFLGPRVFRWINFLCAMALAYLGLSLLINTLQLLFTPAAV